MSKRIGRSVEDEGEQFEVVWPRPEEVYIPPARAYVVPADDRQLTYAEGRQILLDLLEQQITWRTKELLAESMLKQTMFWAVLQHFRRHNQILSPDRGWVSLRRVSVAA